jgi:hypothetical protein
VIGTQQLGYVTLGRANRRPTVGVWPLALEEPPPVLPAPLVAPDPDAVIDLGDVVVTVYALGGCDVPIGCRKPAPKTRKWVSELLKPLRLAG